MCFICWYETDLSLPVCLPLTADLYGLFTMNKVLFVSLVLFLVLPAASGCWTCSLASHRCDVTSQLHNTQIKTILLSCDVLLGNMDSWHVPAEQRDIKSATLTSQILSWSRYKSDPRVELLSFRPTDARSDQDLGNYYFSKLQENQADSRPLRLWSLNLVWRHVHKTNQSQTTLEFCFQPTKPLDWTSHRVLNH